MTINNELLAKFEGKKWDKNEWEPDYSRHPDDRERLWLYLMGQEETWTAFVHYVEEQKKDDYVETLLPWLFLSIDGVPRWVSLLSEWLGMESVREKWGWVECPCPPEFKGDEEIERVCPYCSGTGRILAPWAKYAKEGK